MWKVCKVVSLSVVVSLILVHTALRCFTTSHGISRHPYGKLRIFSGIRHQYPQIWTQNEERWAESGRKQGQRATERREQNLENIIEIFTECRIRTREIWVESCRFMPKVSRKPRFFAQKSRKDRYTISQSRTTSCESLLDRAGRRRAKTGTTRYKTPTEFRQKSQRERDSQSSNGPLSNTDAWNVGLYCCRIPK